MLTKAQEKLIRSLHTKKGRSESGLCLVEGQKNIDAAGSAVEFVFHPNDSNQYNKLVTTDTPQSVAAVAKIPSWTEHDISHSKTIVVLDGVQDPGNVGSIIRLCQAFSASLVLVESADPTNSKVIRSSAGSVFSAPWITIERNQATSFIAQLNRPVFRLEKSEGHTSMTDEQIVLIAGSEGHGIQLDIAGTSVSVKHDSSLESLNVTHALAITLHSRYTQ